MDDDFAVWLQRQIEADLSEWREQEAAFLRDVEREGDWLYFKARERVAHCEAELAILDACNSQVREATLQADIISTEEYVATEAIGALVVRLLGSGYRHRPGYREEWKP